MHVLAAYYQFINYTSNEILETQWANTKDQICKMAFPFKRPFVQCAAQVIEKYNARRPKEGQNAGNRDENAGNARNMDNRDVNQGNQDENAENARNVGDPQNHQGNPWHTIVFTLILGLSCAIIYKIYQFYTKNSSIP
jgi:hypothetical protein